MKAQKKTAYQQHVEKMDQEDRPSLYGKDREEERLLAKVNERRRTRAQQLVEYLQHAKSWEPPKCIYPRKATDSDTGDTEGCQGGAQNKEIRTYKAQIPMTDDRYWVSFGHLHDYLKKVIGGWKLHLRDTLGFCGVAVFGIAAIAFGVVYFQSGFIEPSTLVVSTVVLAALLIAHGIGALIGSLILGIPKAIQLEKSTRKAMPALAARRHLISFFDSRPERVNECSSSERVLQQVQEPIGDPDALVL